MPGPAQSHALLLEQQCTPLLTRATRFLLCSACRAYIAQQTSTRLTHSAIHLFTHKIHKIQICVSYSEWCLTAL